jgi:type IV pilus assembly protein PilB
VVNGYNEGFAEALVAQGLITEVQLGEAAEAARQQNSTIPTMLVRSGYITSEQLMDALSAFMDAPRVKLNPQAIVGEVAKLLDADKAWEHRVLPVSVQDNDLTVAVCGPISDQVSEMLSFKTGLSLQFVLCPEQEILAALAVVYGAVISPEAEEEGKEKLLQFIEGDVAEPPPGSAEVDEADIVKIVDGMLAHAISIGASDIHIEPKLDRADVRLRLDGILRNYEVLPGEQHHAVVSRIKILSKLDIAERRRPQDGVIFVKYGGADVDFRVATTPTIYGEGVVLRVLDQGRATIKLTDLGFTERDLDKTMAALDEPYGFVLSTGPTGSGKTTTMYAMLNKLNRTERKIITIEDPPEYRMDNINQIPVNNAIDNGFAPLLRSVLRQDPNIILVGEIRDSETAHTAVQAALTGHLLLSTLHTTDAPEVLLRLMEIGVEYFYVREVVKLIVAQRLVRQLCPQCKVDYAPTPREIEELGLEPGSQVALKGPHGCENCHNTGYVHRTGVFETMPMTPEIKDMMAPEVRLSHVRETAIAQGMRTLWQNAVEKVLAGETSVDEIKRTVPR